MAGFGSYKPPTCAFPGVDVGLGVREVPHHCVHLSAIIFVAAAALWLGLALQADAGLAGQSLPHVLF